jgi:DNA-binding response OmpR family regulator
MRLLLVEDERKVASFIARSLREKAYTVDVVENGEKALELAPRVTYDAILLDIRLPTITGIQVCRELRELRVETPILFLTARSLVEQRVEGLDAGADDYLAKPFALAELHARIRALTRRGLGQGAATLRCGDLELDRHRRVARSDGHEIPLTPKEFSLLELLMLRAPNPVTRMEIIEHVWSYGFDTETNLVDVYINHLRQKLEPGQQVKFIHTVRGVGYQLRPAEW